MRRIIVALAVFVASVVAGFAAEGVTAEAPALTSTSAMTGPAPGLHVRRRADLEAWSRTVAERQAADRAARPDGEPGSKAYSLQLTNGFWGRYAYGDTWFVMGEVRNSGTTTVCFVKIDMSFRRSGVEIASDWAYVDGTNLTLTSIDMETDTCLGPTQTGFFGTYVDVDWASATAVTYSFDADETSTRQPDATVVVDGSISRSNSYGDVKLSGYLKNTSRAAAKFCKVNALLRGTGDELLDVDFTYVDGVSLGGSTSGLLAGTRGPFVMYTLADYASHRSTTTRTAWDDHGTAPACSYSTNPGTLVFNHAGGSSSVTVSTQTGCEWTAASGGSWLRITSGTSSSGSGQLRYTVDANNGSASRSTTLTVAGDRYNVSQNYLDCSVTVSPTRATFPVEGGDGVLTVSAASGCTWTAASNGWWIVVNGSASGSGNGQVSYTVVPSSLTVVRTGSLTVGDASLEVSQAAGEAPGPAARRLVPGVAHAAGSGGSAWRTSLEVCNPTDGTAEVVLSLRSASGRVDRTVTVPTGGLLRWDDVVPELFEVMVDAAGAVEVAADAEVVMAARTYNLSNDGTFGQFLPGVSADEALADGESGLLGMIARGSDMRTNVGFVQLGDGACTVELHVLNPDGSRVGGPVWTEVPPWGWIQVNDVTVAAGAGTLARGSVTVEALTPGCAVWGYASVVDSRTGDPFTVPMVKIK